MPPGRPAKYANDEERRLARNAIVRAWQKRKRESDPEWAAAQIAKLHALPRPPKNDARRERRRLYRQTPTGKIACHMKRAKRRAAKKGGAAALSSDEKEQLRTLYRQARLLCESGEPHDVDPVVPLSRGGKHHPMNARVIARADNIAKGNKLDHEIECPILRARLIASDPILQ